MVQYQHGLTYLINVDLGDVTTINRMDHINFDMHHNHDRALANMMHVQSS